MTTPSVFLKTEANLKEKLFLFEQCREEILAEEEILAPIVENVGHYAMSTNYDCTKPEFDIFISGNKEVLLTFLRYFYSKGFRPDDKPETKETNFSTWFRNPNVSFNYYFNFASTVCQKVQVGTKMEEVPVYEIRCGDSLELSIEETL